jgi:type I restriction enzyme M protein
MPAQAIWSLPPQRAYRDNAGALGRYVGAEDAEEDDEPLDAKIGRLKKDLYEAFGESNRLQARVRGSLERLDA